MSAKPQVEFRWMIAQIRPFAGWHFGSLGCVVFSGGLALLDPLIIKWLIDDLLLRRSAAWLWAVTGAYLLTYAGRLALDGLSLTLSFRAIQRMLFRIRLNLLRHVQRLPAEFHESRPVGETMYRLERDVEQIGEIGVQAITSLLRVCVITSLTLTMMCALNFRLTCVTLPLIPAFLLMRHRFQRRLRQCSEIAQEQAARVSSFLQEHLAALVQVQLLVRELTEARRFARLAGESTRAQIARRRTEVLFSSLSALVVVFGMATVLGYGGFQVRDGRLSVGGLVAFYSYALQLFVPLYGVVDVYSKLQRARASTRRILEVLQTEPTVVDRPDASPLPHTAPGAVEFRNVSFSYRADRPTLRQITFRIAPGERVALVGRSGSGKSTVARLLARLSETQEGAVLVAARDVREVELKSLRSTLCLVPQDAALFDGTLRENLLFGHPRADDVELCEAAGLAQLDDLIARLPGGWNEPVGPRGSRLSGGEKQRVALARALLRRPRILLLDESTSALDALTEQKFLQALGKSSADQTVIVISHRLSTILWADRLFVIEDGRIVAEGSPARLCQNGKMLEKFCEDRSGADMSFATTP